MDWRVVALVIVTTLVAVGYVVLGVMLGAARRARERAERRAREMEAVARRLLDVARIKEMGDEEAAKELERLLSGWSPVDPPGLRRDE